MSELLVAVYGSLRQGLGAVERLGLQDRLEPRGRCLLAGILYDLGDYPGLVAAQDPVPGVAGELYALADAATLTALDRYEDYAPNDPSHSPFVRERVQLSTPETLAWVYFYNGPVDPRTRVESGDWLEHLRARVG